MPINDAEKRKNYYRERYHATREQAINYMATQHAQRILELAREHANEPRPEYAVAAYLKEHCKFKPTGV